MKKGMLSVIVAVAFLFGAGTMIPRANGATWDKDTHKEAKKTFKRKQCSGCHDVETEELGEKGPGLKGVYKKRGKEWLTKWLKDPEGMVTTDPDMKKLAEKYPDGMPNPELSDDQLEIILLFLEHDGQKPD